MLFKSTLRTIKKSLGRYFAILAIIALGVGFFAGLRVTEATMLKTADGYIGEKNLYDFRLISTLGLTEDDVEEFAKLDGIDVARGSVSADLIIKQNDGSDAVLHAHTLLDGINGLEVLHGRLPEKDNECVLDSRYRGEDAIGTKLTLSDNNSEETFDTFTYDEYTVVGIVDASEYINFQRGTTALSGGTVAGYTYLPRGGFDTDYYTEIFLSIPTDAEMYSEEYETAVDNIRASVEALLAERADIRFDIIYNDAKAELDDAQATLDEKKQELADAKTELDNAKSDLDKGWAALNEIKNSPMFALPEVQAQVAAQESVLQEAESKYADGLAEYNENKATADEKFAKAEKEIADGYADLAVLEKPTVYTLDRSSNFGYTGFENDIQIVSGVAKVFPIFFFLVAALVCITTMTRMVSEQRTQNGVLKALGYSSFAIASQYLIYAGSASIFGCIIGFLIGSKFLPLILWEVYHIMYTIARPAAFVFDVGLLVLCTVLYLVCSLGVTYGVCRKDLRESAAQLMRPKSPSAGKRIFLERIGFIWRPMKFLHKVSVRNILRYKKRMFMMIVGIGGCMALLLTGFGIRDTIQPIVEYQYGEINLHDASVSFLHEPNEEEKATFEDGIGDFAESSVLLHTGNLTLTAGDNSADVTVLAYRDSLEKYVDLHSGDEKVAFPEKNQAVINFRLAEQYNISVGDTIKLRDGDYREATVTVSGIFDNYIYDYIYLSEETYEDGFGYVPEMNTAYLTFAEGKDHHEAGAELLSMDNVASVSLVEDMRESVGNMLETLNYIVLIVLVCAGALAFIVLYNLTNITITERTREIATLKVLGFYRGEQNSYVFRENIILSVIGTICGIPLGIALLHYTMGQIQIDNFYFGCRLSGLSYLWCFLITLLFTIIVDFALTAKLKKINMAEAMKAIE